MPSFSVLSPTLLTLLPILLAFVLLFELVAVIICFIRRSRNRFSMAELLAENLLFAQLLIFTLIAADTVYQVETGFLSLHSYLPIRLVLYLGSLALGLFLTLGERNLKHLFIPVSLLLTFLEFEGLSVFFSNLLCFTLLCFWLLRAIVLFLRYESTKSRYFSTLSVKEATDAMPFGLLLFRAEGPNKGEFLLCNPKMEELMETLTGSLCHSGTDFYKRLVQNRIQPGCRKYPSNALTLFSLPDESVWDFVLSDLTLYGKAHHLLMASDDSAVYAATGELRDRNRALEIQNAELKRMLEEMEEVCRLEETIYLKGQIHDLLGQKITLLLRAMREGKPFDRSLLSSVSKGLSEALKEQTLTGSYSMKMLIDDFKGLGVTVHTTGEFPKEAGVQKVCFEVSMEAMTNAVRHGYATEIWITCTETEETRILRISDNGLGSSLTLTEGGGFQGMRRKAQKIGGTFRFFTKPQFTVELNIPKGEHI